MKVIGGARRPGASSESFRGACGGVGMRDKALSREKSGGLDTAQYPVNQQIEAGEPVVP